MFEKHEYILTLFLLQGNFAKKNRLRGLAQLANSTHDLKLQTKINVILDLADSHFLEERELTYKEWSQLIIRRKEELVMYAQGMIESKIPTWKIIAEQHGWFDSKYEGLKKETE